jgi:PAS domain S-box-containing protein
MDRLHPVLQRQLARLGVASAERAPTDAQWQELLRRVSRVYHEADAERSLLERSQDLASQEMTELYRALEAKRDDLEQRVAERTRRLQESQTHLAEAQRIATLGSWSYAPATGRHEWSEECYRLLGLDPARGTPTFDDVLALIHPDDRERTRDMIRRAYREGANGDTEIRIVRENGQVLWLHALGETFTGPGGEVVLLRGTLRDITRQKEAELARDRATERLNTALAGSSLILVDVDPDGGVFLSERWNELLGG